MRATTDNQCDFCAVIRHPEDGRILVIDKGCGGQTLPHWMGQRIRWQAADAVVPMIEKELGLQTRMLRCLGVGHSPDSQRPALAYEMAACDPLQAKRPDFHWVNAKEMGESLLPRAFRKSDLAAVICHFEEDSVPRNRASWAVRGWFQDSEEWILGQLNAAGVRPKGQVEQIHARQRGHISRIDTDRGFVYFKACPPFFPQELPITKWLSQRFPTSAPSILAHDDERQWLLMQESVGPRLDTISAPGDWQDALTAYADIQIGCSQAIDELLAIGCPDRRLRVLREQAQELVANSEALQVGGFAFSDRELALLREMVPLLQDACDKLADYNLPDAIEHGDFAAFNIIKAPDGFVFFDWSEASVAHPFMGAVAFSERVEGYGVDLTQLREKEWGQLENAYLCRWEQFEPRQRLRRAYALAQPLSALHYALSSKVFVLPSIEVRWEEENMFVYYARMVLKYGNQLKAGIG